METEDIKSTFWKDYIKEDYFGRKELMNKLTKAPILQSLLKHLDYPEEVKEYSFINLLQSYFDDLLEEINSSVSPSATLEKPKETNISFIQDCCDCRKCEHLNYCKEPSNYKCKIFEERSPK